MTDWRFGAAERMTRLGDIVILLLQWRMVRTSPSKPAEHPFCEDPLLFVHTVRMTGLRLAQSPALGSGAGLSPRPARPRTSVVAEYSPGPWRGLSRQRSLWQYGAQLVLRSLSRRALRGLLCNQRRASSSEIPALRSWRRT